MVTGDTRKPDVRGHKPLNIQSHNSDILCRSTVVALHLPLLPASAALLHQESRYSPAQHKLSLSGRTRMVDVWPESVIYIDSMFSVQRVKLIHTTRLQCERLCIQAAWCARSGAVPGALTHVIAAQEPPSG